MKEVFFLSNCIKRRKNTYKYEESFSKAVYKIQKCAIIMIEKILTKMISEFCIIC